MAKKIERIRYSDVELREFKAIIEKQLERSKKMLEYLEEAIQSKPDDIEICAKIAVQTYTLSELEEALERVKKRHFGVCEVTRQLINKKSLQLIPYLRTIEDEEILLGKK